MFALEICQTVRIDCHFFLSRIRISVRPSNFFIGEKTPNKLGLSRKRSRRTSVQLNEPATDRNGSNYSHG